MQSFEELSLQINEGDWNVGSKGMDASKIMKTLKLKEDKKIKLLCIGNVSMENLVRSAIKATGNP